ncbi:DUF4202 domain-containing protein [Sedimenticola selenatireducens]|uniref:DUF4202 domain-containing protein n=1 Tax=Sedimenticola selenatireducens TaxID=191960 RepID=A0A558DQ02_9GAMM|nr:DUF4202 domain-containing protein [Sedimenticola selenatireducens]TVO70446.1 DUF4202 domain-containing protein [Sedimenticola selenatireducens]TVT63023.1 MAG: DUF4202 domain-containing protein [Sedimenticola selenatireducens]
MSAQQKFDRAIELFDQANSADPNQVTVDGETWPKELIYSHRMSEMLQRFAPDTDDAMKLAIRGQHIQRWMSPRKDYPEGRQGYFQWRTNLYKFHAETTGKLMAEAGYDETSIERAMKAVGKKALKINPDSQLLEDIADLVFIEHYMLEFVEKHPEYDEEKWLDIVRKTWKKMSASAQQFALSGAVKLPEPLVPLIQKAVAAD